MEADGVTKRGCIFVTPTLPDRNGSGLQQRAFAWVVDLSRDYDVWLVLALDEPIQPADLRERTSQFEAYVTGVETAPVSKAPRWLRALALLLPFLVRWKPAWAGDWLHPRAWHPHLPEHVEQVITFRMRALLVGEVISRLCNVARVAVDLDDVESSTLASISRRALQRGDLKLAIHLYLAAHQYRVLEATRLKRVSRVYVSSPQDALLLNMRHPETTILTRPNKVRLAQCGTVRSLPDIFRLFFAGTLNYFPNADAVLWIVEELLPVMRTRMSAPFQIVIAGRGATASLRSRLAQVPEVQFLGEVADLQGLYATCHAALAPVRCGGGTKLKVLEAVAHRCPVIGTTHAFRGLPFVAKDHVFVADTPSQVVDACITVSTDSAMAEGMSESARNVMLQHKLCFTPDDSIAC